MAEKTGAGRQPQEFDAENGRYLGNNKGYNSQSDINNLPVGHKISLSKQEYGVLRQEVMRKNSAQKGKVKPNNFAFTSNYFYVYSTIGDDDFKPIVQLDIEKDRREINYWLTYFGG